jgi:hypothetical protein
LVAMAYVLPIAEYTLQPLLRSQRKTDTHRRRREAAEVEDLSHHCRS